MFERRREKVLLAAVGALLLILVGDQLVVGPLLRHYDDLDGRIAALREELDEADRLDRHADDLERRCAYVEGRLRDDSEAFRNEFRMYLESRIGPGVQITSAKQLDHSALVELADMRVLRFELEMTGPLDAQRRALAYLDTSAELLRVENLRMARTSSEDRSLTVRMVVSTVTRAPKGP